MTRKDFVAIAEAIRDSREALGPPLPAQTEQVFTSMAKSIARVCAGQNPRFDRAKFLDACGVKGV